MPDIQEIFLISEPCVRYSRTSPYSRKHASDIQEFPSSRKPAGDTHKLPLIQGNLSKIFKNFPAYMKCKFSLPLSQKLPICPFPKADETGRPITIPFLIYILISFFFVAYVSHVADFLHPFSRNSFKDIFFFEYIQDI